MFASLSRFRRLTAVLSVLALMASVLAAAPIAAADDPEPDYTATFSACVGDAAESAGFEDVPANHTNAGDIDCIAYYGITMGTGDGSTYSPSMSVTREQMALFLTRLAKVVGIDVAADPSDAGFTDIGDLGSESQTAINQLADLGITVGTGDGSTYSPAGSVTRGQMALFIARLMDEMDPMAEDSDTVFGYTPEDVGVVNVIDTDNNNTADEPGEAKSPFTDLDSVTKEAYDAITALWELGVASGISATSYGPAALIIRSAMAEFMAGVLDHSNARPAGVSIQASETWDFGGFSPTIAVSYRDDMFKPMADVSIKTFASGNEVDEGVGSLNEDGGCADPDACAWTDDDSLTDASGNIFEGGNVSDGQTNTYYAWMGDPDADENNFDVDTSPHATVTLSSTTDSVNLKVTTDINRNSQGGNTEDIDGDGSVTLTAQLVDSDGVAVAKSGVEVSLTVMHGRNPLYPGPAPVKTDDDGQVTYTLSGPKSTKGANDSDRTDTVQFRADANGDGTLGAADSTDASNPSEQVTATVVWTDSNPTLGTAVATTTEGGDPLSREAVGSGKGDAPAYALRNSKNEVTIRATVAFYDQYGNAVGKGSSISITIPPADAEPRTISSNGTASWRATVVQATLGGTVAVTYTTLQDAGGNTISGVTVTPTNVLAVEHAPDDSSNDAADINAVYGDENRFLIAGLLYTYDDNDVFISDAGDDVDGEMLDLAGFEKAIGANLDAQPGNQANIEVVAYDDDGSSVFRVRTAAS